MYSFAIAMHEVFSLQIPFEQYDVDQHLNKVVKRNERPKIPKKWPGYLKPLLQSSWSPVISQRPKISRIKALLKTDMNLRAAGGFGNRSNDLLERSRRSVHNLGRSSPTMDRSDHSSR